MKFLKELDKINAHFEEICNMADFDINLKVIFWGDMHGVIKVTMTKYKNKLKRVKDYWEFDDGMMDKEVWDVEIPDLKDYDDLLIFRLNCLKDYLNEHILKYGLKSLFIDIKEAEIERKNHMY